MHLYPNPVDQVIHLQYQLALRGRVTLHILDSSGRKVRTTHLEGVFGANNYSWSVSGLKAGMYHLQMIHPGGSMSRKFLKL
jgi:hypothetical protein